MSEFNNSTCPSDSDTVLSLFSKESICEEGSLTAIFAIIFFGLFFLSRNILHRNNKKYLEANPPTNDEERELLNGMPSYLTDAPVAATSNWGKFKRFFEETFVAPFVMADMESFVAVIFFLWFTMTIPMALTRLYEKRWANQLVAQHGPLNLLSQSLGCKTIDMTAIPYTVDLTGPPPRKRRLLGRILRRAPTTPIEDLELNQNLDYFFTTHLFFGMCWLFAGTIQIYWARKGWSPIAAIRHKAHKKFGRFIALPACLGHVFFALHMAIRNPVNQVFAIRMQYFATVAESLLLVIIGIKHAIQAQAVKKQAEEEGEYDPTTDSPAGEYEHEYKENIAMHKVRMCFAFFQSMFGSGAIRLTSWWLWMLGKFLPHWLRMRVDRGECQSCAKGLYNNYQVGSADHCFTAVFVNLAVTDALVLWLEWLFLCLPNNEWNTLDKEKTVSKFKHLCFLLGVFLLMLPFPELDFYAQIWVILYAGAIRFSGIRYWIIGRPGDNFPGMALLQGYFFVGNPGPHEHHD